MATNTGLEDRVREQFVAVASEITTSFPELDVRFSLREGTNRLCYQVAHVSGKTFQLELGRSDTRKLVHEAIFTIKQVARLFDD